jgi:DNA-binding NtrC family response regulator
MNDRFLRTYLKSRRLLPPPGEGDLPTLDDLVTGYIRYVLALTHHNVARSARILSVSRTTLYNRIQRDRA